MEVIDRKRHDTEEEQELLQKNLQKEEMPMDTPGMITGAEYDETMRKLLGDEYEDKITDDSGLYSPSIRNIFFPSHFEESVKRFFAGKEKKCAICSAAMDLTIDHIKPVSQYFNEEGYKKQRNVRNAWYNNTGNLQYLCRRCNSGKGGERYDPACIRYCVQHGLV